MESCCASLLMVLPWPLAQEIAFAELVSALFPAASAADESVSGLALRFWSVDNAVFTFDKSV